LPKDSARSTACMSSGMAGLHRDRYYEYAPDRAWDLVTGDAITTRIDADDPPGPTPTLSPLIEVLEHGVEGAPRWVVVNVSARGWPARIHAVAAESRRCGYVAVAVDVYLRIRSLLAEALSTRALVLLAKPDTRMESARAALLHAAAASSRPHVLITFRADRRRAATPGFSVTGRDRLSERPAPNVAWQVREARVMYGARRLQAIVPAVVPDDVVRLIERGRRATSFVWAGRHAAAERLLREVAAALVRRRTPASAAAVYIRLGQILLERGSAKAADAAFADAADLAESVDPTLLASARIWQAAARTDAGHLSSAESLCRAALLTGALDEVERARAEATLARVLIWQGRVPEARTLAFISGSHTTPFVCATAVRVLVETGEIFDAGRWARDLLEATEAASDPTGRVMGLAAHLRVVLAAGDLTLAAERLRALAAASRTARTPLRLVRMRILWVDALRRAGRSRDAERDLRALTRMRSAVPPMLRTAIDRCVRGPARIVASTALGARDVPQGAADLVALAQREDQDEVALKGICEFVARHIRAARVDLWTADAGPASMVMSTGAGLPTQCGERALDAGIVIGPEAVQSGCELASPIRLGSRVVAALAVRWPADREAPDDAARVLALACAVAAPRVDSMVHDRRRIANAATSIPELIGGSGAMTDVRRAIGRAAAAPFSVLIEGESGVGKELVARAIHQLSLRRERRFCDVNCAALPDELLESELFGHTRGAFTGAVADRAGLLEEADGGTLFLDEVADLSARAQAKLLRVVQQQEVRRVGETFSRKVDVRFVCAANRELRAEAEQGRFRHDLLYRLDVIRIRIPPLRDRPEDVPLLALHFWTTAAARVGTRAALSHATLAALARHHWPGNVRELQNVMSALAVEAPMRGQVRAMLLPAVITGATPMASGRLSEARAQWERRFVEVALARAGGNRSRAARELGLTRQGLLKLFDRLGLASDERR